MELLSVYSKVFDFDFKIFCSVKASAHVIFIYNYVMAYNDILIFLRSQKYVPSYIYLYTTRLVQKFKTLTPAPTSHLASSSVMKKVPLNQSYKLLAKHSKIDA